MHHKPGASHTDLLRTRVICDTSLCRTSRTQTLRLSQIVYISPIGLLLHSTNTDRIANNVRARLHPLVLPAPPCHRSDGEPPEGHYPEHGNTNVSPTDIAIRDVKSPQIFVSVRVTTVSTVGIRVRVVNVSSRRCKEIGQIR